MEGTDADIDQAPKGVVDAAVKGRADKADTGCSDRERFQLELEFVQSLANPHYINYLAQTRVLDDPAFVNYLRYLEYWQQPEYAKFIIFPHGLYFLELLQNESFRKILADQRTTEFIHSQQLYFWLHYRNTRLEALQRLEETEKELKPETATTQEAALPVGLYTVFKDNLDPAVVKDELTS